MAVTHKWAGLALTGQFGSTAARRVDWPADTIAVTLHTSAFTFDQDAHDFRNDLTNEVSGTGYTAGGVNLANKSVTYDTATNKTILDADNISWTTSTITARGAAVQKVIGGATSADPLLSYIDFGSDQSTVAGTFAINWPADGVLHVVAS